MIFTLNDGASVTVDLDAQTVTVESDQADPTGAHEDIGRYAQALMNSGAMCGPQVDEFTGWTAGWNQRGAFVAVWEAARDWGRQIVSGAPEF